ncbi:hypothetical protein V496_10532 [Pseudogymnoascus sp. VKM F-4515 (FW-2607)]|nr:hypothetical protein V496_10532 [Pseudogymnoascus sp. VKM F-4515 (FW-2607)]
MGDSSRSNTMYFDAIPQMEPIDGVHAQLSDQDLLQKIDKLRELGVHEFVSLPQLVVVGDQSSGKSSVLEAVMQLPLPRSGTLCTRFATNITFQSAPKPRITVSIIPGPSRSDEKKKLLQDFKRELTALDGGSFLSILNEACDAMGVPKPEELFDVDGSKSKPTFSEDVFKVELCGPGRDNLSIIDIPGIFRLETAGTTTLKDMAMVKKMVDYWIKDERTIILAVIPINNDIATQEILSIAKEADPKGLRTLGILTKPDMVGDGEEGRVFDLINGKQHKLTLGYHVLRNLSQKDVDTQKNLNGRNDSLSRGTKEQEFFNKKPWSALPKSRVGVDELKKRLTVLLTDMVKKEFPNIKSQLAKDLVLAKKQLAMIGTERATPQQQRVYLEEIAAKFKDLSKLALDGDYQDEIIQNDKCLRLPTLIANRCDLFEKEIRTKGHTYEFDNDEGNGSGNDEDDDDDDDEATSIASENESATDENESGKGYEDKPTPKPIGPVFPELDNVLSQSFNILDTNKTNILHWIRRQYLESRGYGLPAIDIRILPVLWQKQSSNWSGITLSFINDIIVYVHDFICRLLSIVCPESKVRNALLSFFMDDLVAKYSSAIKHVEYILKVEHRGTLLTKNESYSTALNDMRNARQGKATEDPAADPAKSNSNEKSVVQDQHDFLHAYYKVAIRRFVDTVIAQGMDDYLLKGDNSPIKVINLSFTSKMNDDQINDIAGEDAFTKGERLALEEKIKALEEGRKELNS